MTSQEIHRDQKEHINQKNNEYEMARSLDRKADKEYLENNLRRIRHEDAQKNTTYEKIKEDFVKYNDKQMYSNK